MQALVDSFERLLNDRCTPNDVRAIETGASAESLWQMLHASGFADALRTEARGGAGLALCDVFPILLLCGKYALPLPLAPTMVARAILADAGQHVPDGPVTIAPNAQRAADGTITCTRVPYGRVAGWVLADLGDVVALLPIGKAQVESTGVHASLEADLQWHSLPKDAPCLPRTFDCLAVGACLLAAQLAGAMERILATTIRYANERVQFGRSIAKFQVIQHHLSVMAEQTLAARMAAQMACQSASHLPDSSLAAVGKARTGEAAVTVAALGHAVHGAMGFTAEYQLQLYTRRLHEWRMAYGSEAYWNEKIGAALLACKDVPALDFIRGPLFPVG